MTKIKLVKTAKIECIKPNDLKVGDYILWNKFKCKVTFINKLSRYGEENFAEIEQFLDEPESKMMIPRYSCFYKILEAEIIEESLDNEYSEEEGEQIVS